jgi:hypothetical protein
MKYIIFRKTFGTKEVLTFSEFQTSNPICDMLWIEDLGLIYTSNNIIGLINDNGEHVQQWMGDCDAETPKNGSRPNFGYLSGLSYCSRTKNIFVGEDGGRDIRAIDINSDYTSSLIQGQSRKFIDNVLRKMPLKTTVHLASDKRGNIFLSYPDIRKCFCFSNCELKHIIGDGKCRFSNGTDAICSSIGCPNGIASYEKDVIISDSFSGVVRAFDGKVVNLLCGHPQNSVLENPSKLLVQKNSLYILCKNSIRLFSFVNGVIGRSPVYESDNILNIANDNNNGLYILEKINA